MGGPGSGRRRAAHQPEPSAKAAAMAALYRSGMTMAEIGEQFGCSRQAVQQMVRRHCGVTGNDGGATARKQRRLLAKAIRRDARSVATFGCVWDRVVELRRIGAVKAYNTQRANAEHRSIAWELNLWQWWSIWLESGRWEQRGRKRGQYVMCRKGDVGPYAIDNVFIGLASDNVRDGVVRYWINRRAAHDELREAA